MKFNFIFFVIYSLVKQAEWVFALNYCTEPTGPPGPDGTVPCQGSMTYAPSLQLCCGTQTSGDPNERVFENIPLPGEKGSVPSNCKMPARKPDVQLCPADYDFYDQFFLCCKGEPSFTAIPTSGIDPPGGGIGSRPLNPDGTSPIDGNTPRIVHIDPPLVPIRPRLFPDEVEPGLFCRAGPIINGLMVCPSATHPYNAQYKSCCGRSTTSSFDSNQFICADKSLPGLPSDCPQRAYLCDVPEWIPLMTDQCAVTCKRCGTRAAIGTTDQSTSAYQYANIQYQSNNLIGNTVPSDPTICSDRQVPGRPSECEDNRKYCDYPKYFDLMTVQCPFTCKRCGVRPGTTDVINNYSPGIYNANNNLGLFNDSYDGGRIAGCVDKRKSDNTSDCPGRAELCTTGLLIMQKFMQDECPYTCDRNGCRTGRITNFNSPPLTSSLRLGANPPPSLSRIVEPESAHPPPVSNKFSRNILPPSIQSE